MAINTFSSTDLSVNLTPEERLRVAVFSATKGADLPKFFNAGTQALGDAPNETISREFESFLILQSLQSPNKLSDAMLWFSEAATLQLQREDRDNLLSAAYANEKSDALAKLQEFRARSKRFNAFRDSFKRVEVGAATENPLDYPPERFSTVPEISLIMRDSQAAMGEVASGQKRAEFRVVANEVLDQARQIRFETEDSVSGITDDKIAEELLSWRNVISDIAARVIGT
jgi:hypothetical protein